VELNLTGKSALVTGASSGLGEAAATTLASEGVAVTIVARSMDKLNAAADRIKKSTGNRPTCLEADISTPDGLKQIGSHASGGQPGGNIDILISNGGGPPPGDFTTHSEESWQDSHDLVLASAIGLTRAVIEGMCARGWGRLIYITSVGVLQPIDELILSNTYRAGVTGFCKTISNTYASFGITANCVCPGYTATERLKSLAATRAEQAGKSPQEILDSIAATIPVGRVGRPEELAALISFLASDRAAYITGTSIPVDGGLVRALV